MIHILWGEEDFRVREKIAEISNNDFNFLSFKSNDFFLNFQAEINKKLWLKNPFLVITDFRNLKGWEPFFMMIKNYKPNLIFVFKEKSDWFVKILKNLQIDYKIHQIERKSTGKNRFSRTNFQRWMEETLNKHNVKLHPITKEALCEAFSKSPSLLLAEIEKLSYYKKNQLITAEEIKALIKQPNESRVFEMLNFLQEKDFKRFFSYLKREIDVMSKPEQEILLLLGLLGATVYKMLLLKTAKEENQIHQINDIDPFLKHKLLLASYKFSETELKRLYNIITTLERRYKKYHIKVSEISEEMIVQMLYIK
jgi:DNA polymerase III delta subunit